MRLKSEIWIKAYIRRCQVNDAPAFIMRRGQSDGGAIFIKINRLDGAVDLYVPAPAGIDAGSGRLWAQHGADSIMNNSDVEAYLARQAEFDPDLWVVEVEDRSGRHFLDDDLFAD